MKLFGAVRRLSHLSITVVLVVVLTLFTLLLGQSAQAQEASKSLPSGILAIVSDRSNAELVAGAHQFIAQQQAQINIRSLSQINLLNDAQLQALIEQHSSVLFAGVFGESVERLLAFKYLAQQQRYVVSSDRRLLALHQDALNGSFAKLDASQRKQLTKRFTKNNYLAELSKQQQQWPEFAFWLQTRAYWQNRGKENLSHMLMWLQQLSDYSSNPKTTNNEQSSRLISQAPQIFPLEAMRFYLDEQRISPEALAKQLANESSKPAVFVLDHDTGDQAGQWQLHQALCQQAWHCISVLAAWGSASEQAVAEISALNVTQPFAVIALQDFVIGGGEGRQAVTNSFAKLNVPVIKGIRVTEHTQNQYVLSSQGLPSDSVHYRVAMPELQGIAQPHVLALASNLQRDNLTGALVNRSEVQHDEVVRIQSRINKWFALQTLANKDKKVAIVYYNHPPGRHNIGADNLDVEQSLWQMLLRLKAEGYDLGADADFPKSSAELLDLLQQKAVNLPQDAGALKAMSPLVYNMPIAQYQQYFSSLPLDVQAEMTDGPLGFLHQQVNYYLKGDGAKQLKTMLPTARIELLKTLKHTIENTEHDLHHALDGIRHTSRERALDLLSQLAHYYEDLVDQQIAGLTLISDSQWQKAEQLKNALVDMHIEGIRGWGAAPGNTMVWQQQIVLPGIQLGNLFLGPQPPRGWEINEELLHANMSFPPPHQYLAFYHYLRDIFAANAIVHLGRHSTFEFLPKRAVGLTASDYPSLIIGDVPSIYPYIVDGVGEGIQAKRRGISVMLDHLTPPLATTELYDGLLQLRQLIESAEAASNNDTKQKAIKALRHKIQVLNLTEELAASMDEELKVRGVGFSDIDDDFLLHEVGHYLTHLQEEFMPLGLHVYGKAWDNQAIATMMTSIEKGEVDLTTEKLNTIKQALSQSPSDEMQALVNALNGGFVAPGKGNDPIRSPDALPTGRNFYALDGSLIPSELGFSIGQQLAVKARGEQRIVERNHKEALILWASDAVRDEGAMIAFGMDMLGVTPVWNQRGILKSLRLVPLDETRKQRRDLVFTTSGLFRDLYAEQLAWLDRSVLLALAASKQTIVDKYPALTAQLNGALKPIEALLEMQTVALNEPLSSNLVAQNWLNEAQILMRAQQQLSPQQTPLSPEEVGRQASFRIFGTAPGAYGAGINRLAERSGAWQERKQLGEAYIKRMSHAYGAAGEHLKLGSNVQQLFRQQLSAVNNTYLGRASNLYGLIDNNDAYDYLGGLNLAIETITGEQPNSFVISHANNQKLSIDPLKKALLAELRGRFLNRQWIEPLMKQGYAGARTMGNEFIENLWGWQATSPEIIRSWVWEEIKNVYVDDALELGLDDFLAEKHNVHVQSNILAVMLVAIEKGFWQADEATQQQLAEQFANNIIAHGIPGSGHTHANHPIYAFIQPKLSADVQQQLEQVLAKANYQPSDASSAVQYQTIQELSELQSEPIEQPDQQAQTNEVTKEANSQNQPLFYWLVLAVSLLVITGFVRSLRAGRKRPKSRYPNPIKD